MLESLRIMLQTPELIVGACAFVFVVCTGYSGLKAERALDDCEAELHELQGEYDELCGICCQQALIIAEDRKLPDAFNLFENRFEDAETVELYGVELN